ncbi:hypothetical protein AKJ57_05985, partial [candidate division MSBL1 archaeon SCGC-AAA259A05]
TLIALSTGLLAGILFSYDEPQWAGLAVLIGSFFDMIDGAVARLTDQVTEFGGILDSVSDRVTDSALYIGVMFGGMASIAEQPPWLLPTLALVGSFLVSYTRARGESAGTGKLDVGIAERAERLLILGFGALLCVTAYAIIIIVVLTVFTIIQRIWVAQSRLN